MTFFKLVGHIGGHTLDKTVKTSSPLISAIEAEITTTLKAVECSLEKTVFVVGEKVAYHKGKSVYIEITKIK